MSDGHGTARPKGRITPRDIVVRVVGLLLVAGVLWWAFTRLVSWSDLVDAIGDLTGRDWLLLVVVSAVRIAIEPLLLMAATPKLRWPRALPAFLAPASAASIVPGPSDLAARYAMFRSWGYSGAQTSASVLLVFLYTTFAKVALPLVAAGFFLAFGRSDKRLMTAATISGGALVAAILIMALLLRSEAMARRLGAAAGTAAQRVAGWFRISTPETLAADLADRAAHFRERTGDIVRTRTHLAASSAALGQVALFAVLLVSVRATGVESTEVDWVTLFAAFAAVQLLTSVPITPSGLGVAEAAYIGLLTAASSAGIGGAIAAAAIIYRLFSWVIVIPLGAVSWAWWSGWGRSGGDSGATMAQRGQADDNAAAPPNRGR
jgi:uncharacterized membrane protein YbhN (UPF0104 family)